MRKSAVISIALHLAIVLWALVAFPTGRALDAPKIEDVPIDIVTPSEFTKIKAGMVDAKDDAPLAPKPEEPKPKAVTEKAPPKNPALPCRPVLPMSALAHGEGKGVTETLSKVAVLSAESLVLVTARPAFTVAAMEIVTVPTCVQALPFADT